MEKVLFAVGAISFLGCLIWLIVCIKNWDSKIPPIIGMVLSTVLILGVLFITLNKGYYEKFAWGEHQVDIEDKLSSWGIDYRYENSFEERIIYVEEDFCGVKDVDGLVYLQLDKDSCLKEVFVYLNLEGNQDINDVSKALRKKYGKPIDDSDISILGIRVGHMKWSTSKFNIEFEMSSSLNYLQLTPKE